MEATQGYAKINGGLVYYLKSPPEGPINLKNELQVLQSFLAAWNEDLPDNPAETKKKDVQVQRPSDTKAFPGATRILVTFSNHPSDRPSSVDQDKHISAMVCSDANWELKKSEEKEPYHEYGALVHIFCRDEDPAQGYRDFWIYQARRRNLTNPDIKQAIANAEAKFLGTLGEGDLV